MELDSILCPLFQLQLQFTNATSLPLEALQNFIDYTNNFHPALQFTHNITKHTLPFLDIQLTIEDDTIATSIYYKDTDAHSFLDYNSSHPSKCKDSIPYSQFRRLRRISSNDEDFHSRAKEMTSFFTRMIILKRSPLLPSKKSTTSHRTTPYYQLTETNLITEYLLPLLITHWITESRE